MDAGNLTPCSGTICYVLAVVNIIFAALTIPENAAVLVALSRLSTKRNWKISNILMASLATTDLLSGCISQSLYGYFLIKQGEHFSIDDLKGADYWLLLVLNYSSYTLCGESLLLVAIMSIDRLLAILRPIAYKANKYRTQIISALFASFLFCFFIPILRFVSQKTVSSFIFIISAVMVLSIVTTITSYIIVMYKFFNLGRHSRLKASRSGAGTGQDSDMAASMSEQTSSCRERRLTKSFAIITFTLVMMYLPQLIIKPFILNPSSAFHKIPVSIADLANTLLYCNSFANPLIYALRHTGIRKELKLMFGGILKKGSAPKTPESYLSTKRTSTDTCSSSETPSQQIDTNLPSGRGIVNTNV